MEALDFEIKDKKTLKRLALEFAEDLTSNYRKEVHLYGAEERILSFFGEELRSCLKEKGRKIDIGFGENGVYNINVGFFLNAGYFKGLNKDY